jgi:predicted ATP-grasp superfamily ATP-dependent carboligase
MSALFLAHRGGIHLLGISRQRMASTRERPYLFEGALGPMALPAGLAARLHEAIHCIARETSLVGLNSIDFLLDAPEFSVLEVNPRPPASMALYPHAYPLGLMHAHLQACQGMLLAPPAEPPPGMRGFRLVFAQRPVQVNAMLAATLLRTGWCHDIPVPGTHVAVGEPLCTVSAAAAIADAASTVEAALQQRCEQIHSLLKDRHDESCCNPDHGRRARAVLAGERQLA